MSTATFPNGQTLASSALTPTAVENLLQPLLAQALGIDPALDPQAYSAVRIGWPPEGQPAPGFDEDICTIRATVENDPYSRVRDDLNEPNNLQSVTRQMGFTQVWNLHLTFRGPNCYGRALVVLSAMTLDWMHDALAEKKLYAIPDWQRPVYAPELFQGRWWKRADLDLKFNELVNESIAADTAAGVDITLIKETGLSTEFTIP